MTPSVLFFLQMFVILATCRLVGLVARRIGQPQVVGEMIAGVMLGPSLFGLFLPEWQNELFPPESRKFLNIGAQLGISLYMFLVGIEFKTELFRSMIRGAAAVSVAGMLAPMTLGILLSMWLVQQSDLQLFAEKTKGFEAALFMGAAMSITAFPMLARIIYERGLTGTGLGTLALAAGAIDDAAAWCILAIVLATFSGAKTGAWYAIGGGIFYAAFTLTLGRYLLSFLGAAVEKAGRLTPTLLAYTLMCFVLAAWFTDFIGIHAVFGGFLLGIAMPRGLLTRELQRQVEPFTVVFLLPIFFTYSGLNTRLDLVNDTNLIIVTLAVLLAACLGKAGACWAAARLHGNDNRTALAIGALMNARGLMELIILNIGLQHGIVLPAFFSIMVVMAIVTTLLASPLFEWVYGRHMRREHANEASHLETCSAHIH